MVRIINSEEEFDAVLKEAGNKLVVVDFFAVWCGPCRVFAPTFEKLATEWPNVIFLKVNTDDVPELAKTYNISALPTFMFFKNGSNVGTVTGASEDAVVQRLNSLSV